MANALKEKAFQSVIEHESPQSRPITYDDIVLSVLYLTSIVSILSCGLYIYGKQSHDLGTVSSLSIIGGGGVLVTSFITMFKKKIGFFFASIISVFQGLMIGGLLAVTSHQTFANGMKPDEIILQAIIALFGATIACCAAYYFKIIRVTNTFRKITFILSLGFFLTYLINFILNVVFHHGLHLFSGGPINIVISIIAVIASSMSLIRSLDDCDILVKNNAPKESRWGLGAASGVTNSIVWLFMEILRLFININRE